MGYAVYEDPWHFGRWAGYAVPGECDALDCHTMIERGMGYQCEKIYVSRFLANEEEVEEEIEGCKLYFCSEHESHSVHGDAVEPKPDHPRWMWWILNHESWEKWRGENPKTVERYIEATKDFEPDDELREELAFSE